MIWKKAIRNLPYEIEKYTRKPVVSRWIAIVLCALTFGILMYFTFKASEVAAETRNYKKQQAIKTRQIDPCSLEAVICPSEVKTPSQVKILPTKAIVVRVSPPKSAVEKRIREIALELGLTKVQTDRAVRIGYCESGLRTTAKGDGTRSRGVWQIFRPAHPTITDDQAHDLEWSTRWALGRMKNGSWSLWSCNRKV